MTDFKVKKYKEILDDMTRYLIAGQDKITSFHEGSVILTLLEAIAMELENQGYAVDNAVKYRIIEYLYSFFGHERKKGTKAQIQVKFRMEEAVTKSMEIRRGTKIKSENGLIYVTGETAVILPGTQESQIVTATAESTGSQYNIEPDTLMSCLEPLGIDAVLPASEGTGGSNEETDEAFDTRFSDFLLGIQKNNCASIRAEILKLPYVKDVKMEEVNVEGTHFTVYVSNHSNTLTQEEQEEIFTIVDKLRGCGVRHRVVGAYRKEIPVLYVTVTKLKEGVAPYNAKKEILQKVLSILDDRRIGEPLFYNEIIKGIHELDCVENFYLNGISAGDLLTCESSEILCAKIPSRDTVETQFL